MRQARRIAASPAVIFVAALTTRLAATVFIFRNYFGPQLLFVQNESSHIASALVTGWGFSSPYANVPVAATAQQPPLYPLILAGIFKLFGICTVSSAWAAVVLNILAGALTAVLLYYVGNLYFTKTVGLVAAWVWALPWMYRALAFSTSLSSPYLAALGLTVLLLLLPKVLKADRGWFTLGIYAGLLVLLQTTFLVVLAFYGIWLAFSKARSPKMLLALAGLCLMLVPWTIRNYVQLGRLVPIRDNFGLELWLGNRPGMQGTVDYHGDFPDHDPSNYAQLGELRFMDEKFQEAKEFIASDPLSFLKRCLRRSFEFWYIPYSPPWILISVLGWAGAVLAWKKKRIAVLLAIPLLAFPPVYYMTHTFPTYRHPIDPVIILLATYGIVEITTWAFGHFMDVDKPWRSHELPRLGVSAR
jgi:4-amino-4-deoxy-L-arabinose transferase-like glycosyltransferase